MKVDKDDKIFEIYNIMVMHAMRKEYDDSKKNESLMEFMKGISIAIITGMLDRKEVTLDDFESQLQERMRTEILNLRKEIEDFNE